MAKKEKKSVSDALVGALADFEEQHPKLASLILTGIPVRMFLYLLLLLFILFIGALKVLQPLTMEAAASTLSGYVLLLEDRLRDGKVTTGKYTGWGWMNGADCGSVDSLPCTKTDPGELLLVTEVHSNQYNACYRITIGVQKKWYYLGDYDLSPYSTNTARISKVACTGRRCRAFKVANCVGTNPVF